MHFPAKLAGIVAVAASSAGCGSRGSVALTVGFENPTITVSDGVFGASLSGGFELRLELGPEAPRSTDVSLAGFALQSASGTGLVDPLPAEPQGVSFPITLGKGEIQRVPFNLNIPALEIPVRDAICGGQAQIAGAVTDSASQRTSPALSVLFTPSCG